MRAESDMFVPFYQKRTFFQEVFPAFSHVILVVRTGSHGPLSFKGDWMNCHPG